MQEKFTWRALRQDYEGRVILMILPIHGHGLFYISIKKQSKKQEITIKQGTGIERLTTNLLSCIIVLS